MKNTADYILMAIVVVAGIAAIYGWFSDKSRKLKEDAFNKALRKQLQEEKEQFERQVSNTMLELQQRSDYLMTLREEFECGYISGYKWLARFIAEADKALDDSISFDLQNKKHPALKAAEEVSIARAEKRKFKEQAKLFEYQIRIYKEYFPFLDDYDELILDEEIDFDQYSQELEMPENTDRTLFYLAKSEYDKMSTIERNQLALDRYLNGRRRKEEIGRLYERYIGYLYEQKGWKVEYHGIVEGFEDLGRDLICRKGSKIVIVQAKCWSSHKLIHEKHIFQLFGTTQLFLTSQQNNNITKENISAVFITTTSLSPVAQRVAKWLEINIRENFALDKTYPMIKCNINRATKEKIYHLPFDQQYDRTKISPELGEFYATSVLEAEQKGFRRAFRHHNK